MIFILLAVAVLLILVMCYELWFNNHPLRVGYVPSNLTLIKPFLLDITSRYKLHPQHVDLYELGCGLAHVLKWYSAQFKWKRVVGIELDFFWYVLATLSVKNKNITILREDVITHKYPKNSVIYSYLVPEILEKMYIENKFNDTFLISLTFPISGIEPTEKIIFPGMQHQLFIYDFRKKIEHL
jgi:hypothetical protein